MRWNIGFNEMELFGPLPALIKARAAAVMAEMEVSAQDKMANPQGIKVFAVERHGLSEDFVPFPALCGLQSSPLVFVPNKPIVWGPLQLL